MTETTTNRTEHLENIAKALISKNFVGLDPSFFAELGMTGRNDFRVANISRDGTIELARYHNKGEPIRTKDYSSIVIKNIQYFLVKFKCIHNTAIWHENHLIQAKTEKQFKQKLKFALRTWRKGEPQLDDNWFVFPDDTAVCYLGKRELTKQEFQTLNKFL